jgi:membrane protease YdiL (CAAX protease family)
LQERIGRWPAIVAAACVFAAFHFNAWTFVPLAAMGAAAGWMTARERSVWPAYALHLAYNGVAVLLTFAFVAK